MISSPPRPLRRNGEWARIWKSVESCSGTRKYVPGAACSRRFSSAVARAVNSFLVRDPSQPGIFGKRVADTVISGSADKAPGRARAPDCTPHRAPRSAGTAYGTRGCRSGSGRSRGQRADRGRVARKPRIVRHAVVFERDPSRPQIAEIGADHGDAAGARLLGGDDVIGAAVAMQHEIGDAVVSRMSPIYVAPFVETGPGNCVAGRRQNSWSPRCRLTRWTRWPRASKARPSRSKNRDSGPCRNRNERAAPFPGRRWRRAGSSRPRIDLVAVTPRLSGQAGSNAERLPQARQRCRPSPRRSRRSTDFQ